MCDLYEHCVVCSSYEDLLNLNEKLYNYFLNNSMQIPFVVVSNSCVDNTTLIKFQKNVSIYYSSLISQKVQIRFCLWSNESNNYVDLAIQNSKCFTIIGPQYSIPNCTNKYDLLKQISTDAIVYGRNGLYVKHASLIENVLHVKFNKDIYVDMNRVGDDIRCLGLSLTFTGQQNKWFIPVCNRYIVCKNSIFLNIELPDIILNQCILGICRSSYDGDHADPFCGIRSNFRSVESIVNTSGQTLYHWACHQTIHVTTIPNKILKRCVVLANCAGEEIINHLYTNKLFRQTYNIPEYIISLYACNDIDASLQKIGYPDLLICQNIKNYVGLNYLDLVKRFLGTKTNIIKLSYWRFAGYWPINSRPGGIVEDTPIEFGQNLSFEEYMNYEYDKQIVKQVFESSFQKFIDIDKESDISMLDFFIKHHHEQQLFSDAMHPTPTFFQEVCKRLLIHLGIVDPKVKQLPWNTKQTVGVRNRIIRSQDMKILNLNFKSNSFISGTQLYYFGEAFTLKEYYYFTRHLSNVEVLDWCDLYIQIVTWKLGQTNKNWRYIFAYGSGSKRSWKFMDDDGDNGFCLPHNDFNLLFEDPLPGVYKNLIFSVYHNGHLKHTQIFNEHDSRPVCYKC